jgi:hypothetical protein
LPAGFAVPASVPAPQLTSMTTAELRVRLVEALKKLGSKSPPVEEFRAALTERQRLSILERDVPGNGLLWAIERALSLYPGGSEPTMPLRREPLDDQFLEQLAHAVEHVPDSVYVRLQRRLVNAGFARTDSVDLVKVMSGALREYALYADDGLTPGP